MRLEYIGLSELSGSLIALEGVTGAAYDEMAEITLENGERRYGRVILLDGDKAVLQVFEGTRGISLENARTHFTGRAMDLALSKEMLGRIFDGAGRPIDGLGEIYPEQRRNINGSAINPVSRQYPRSCIYTGISAIDGCSTLIRGQKLPIFSGSGMKHTSWPLRSSVRPRWPGTTGSSPSSLRPWGSKTIRPSSSAAASKRRAPFSGWSCSATWPATPSSSAS